MRQVSFYYDVVCPYSYLETHAVEAAVDAGELEVHLAAVRAAPGAPPRCSIRAATTCASTGRSNVYRRAHGLGIEIHLPRYQPRSTLPLAACLWATEQGALRAFKGALYEAFFCEGEDISSEVQIARAARGAGLDPDGAIAAAHGAALDRPARRDPREPPRRRASRGVPSLVAGEQQHWGTGGVERLLRGEPLIPRPT